MPKTRFENRPGTPAWRTHRWYQMDYLIREYGITEEDLQRAIGDEGALANADPKETLARGRPAIDPNTAPFNNLIRVPGIGPGTARGILRVRETRPVTPADIGAGRLIAGRAAPFLAIARPSGRQATLPAF